MIVVVRCVVMCSIAELTACGGSGGATLDAGADATAGPDGGADGLAGEIIVVAGGGQAIGRGLGSNASASFPEGEPVAWHTETARAGACRLLEYEPGFCEPACSGVCQAPGECRPWPALRSAGTLTVTGLTVPLALEPLPGNGYATAGGLPETLFTRDAEVAVIASGADLPAFTVTASGVARATTDVAEVGVVTLPPSGDLVVTWPDPDADARVRVTVTAGGQFHGLPSPSILVCDGPDTGSLTMAAALVAAFPPVGRGCAKQHDCSSFGVLRYRRGAVAVGGGEIGLLVGSGTDYEVVHE